MESNSYNYVWGVDMTVCFFNDDYDHKYSCEYEIVDQRFCVTVDYDIDDEIEAENDIKSFGPSTEYKSRDILIVDQSAKTNFLLKDAYYAGSTSVFGSPARARGARVHAELAGYGATCDAYHITAPDPSADGSVKAIDIALADAGVTDKTKVGYINAHGTSTHLNDQMETNAFKRVFGEEQAKKINISSTKPCHGHCLGATGAIEAAVTALAVSEGFVPPTINYENPDLEVDATKGETPLDLNYTPNVGVKRDIEVAISSSLAFGGHNGILVLKKAN